MWSFRSWRRRRVLRHARLPDTQWQAVLKELSVLNGLDRTERDRLRELVILFLHEKSIQAAGDLEIDDAIRLKIAAQACLPILNLGLDYYRNWVEVIVYPGTFLAPHEYVDSSGVAHSVHHSLAGESWEQGPVILSWEDVVEGAADGTGNIVIHEFAHKLDMLNGETNGLPPLHSPMKIEAWSRIFTAAYEDLCRRVDRGLKTPIDPYAAEAPAEFFAVISEEFFVTPDVVHDVYPQVYAQLRDFYRQDPLLRLPARFESQSVPAHADL